MENKIAVCITGWHFGREFYSQIHQLQDADVFIVSHKKKSSVPAFVFEFFPENHILFRKNVGYDWGCYQQFLETDIWKRYEYIFFMHDDVKILDLAFKNESVRLLGNGYAFVGNGRNSDKRDWPQTHLAHYAHSSWMPSSLSFQHDTMRGSFFSTTRDALKKLGKFEVFWDKFNLNMSFGNWSLISSCGKIQALFGAKAYVFLSNDYRTSSFMIEHERGGDASINKQGVKHKIFLKLWPAFYYYAEKYVRQRIQVDDSNNVNHLFLIFFKALMKVI